MKKTRRKKGPVVAKKVVYDGITFDSGLEKFMYTELKKAKIDFEYTAHTFELIPAFQFPNDSYERQSNGKKDYVNRGGKKILNIKYTPDFVGEDFIIETKGRANETFPMRWKIFKWWMTLNNDSRALYKPQNQAECTETINIILSKRQKLEDDMLKGK